MKFKNAVFIFIRLIFKSTNAAIANSKQNAIDVTIKAKFL